MTSPVSFGRVVGRFTIFTSGIETPTPVPAITIGRSVFEITNGITIIEQTVEYNCGLIDLSTKFGQGIIF